MNNQTPSLDLLEFPLDYEFKAFGPNEDDFTERLCLAVGQVVTVSRHALRERSSSGAKYRCVTLLVRVQSREQLEQIYAEIRQVEGLSYLL